MDRLDAMAVFLAIVDEGSLAAAARRLGRSPAGVTRALALLEDRLGERLLHRSTRALRLTPTGERHAALYRAVLADLAEAEAGAAPGIAGRLSLTAPELFGQHKLMPVVAEFLDRHPAVGVRLILLNRVANLVEEGIDLAVRIAPLPDSGLVAVRLGTMRRLICAAPAYLAAAGVPERPTDLSGHRCLGADDGQAREVWGFVDRGGRRPRAVSVPVVPRLASNSTGAVIDAGLRGHGLCRVMAYQVADAVEAGRLVPLLVPFEPEPVPVHLVFHPIPRRDLALRAFVDFATPRLRAAVAQVAQRVAAGLPPQPR